MDSISTLIHSVQSAIHHLTSPFDFEQYISNEDVIVIHAENGAELVRQQIKSTFPNEEIEIFIPLRSFWKRTFDEMIDFIDLPKHFRLSYYVNGEWHFNKLKPAGRRSRKR